MTQKPSISELFWGHTVNKWPAHFNIMLKGTFQVHDKKNDQINTYFFSGFPGCLEKQKLNACLVACAERDA